MTDALEELLEQIAAEERQPDLLDWLETERLTSAAAGRREDAGDAETTSAGHGRAEDVGQDAERSPTSETGAEDQGETGGEEGGPPLRRRRHEEAEAAGGTETGTAEQNGAAFAARAQSQGADVLTGREGGQSVQTLYRQLVRAGQLAAGTGGRTERTVVTQQVTTGAPSLTADELDRAVRRDSRRYDGGMELY